MEDLIAVALVVGAQDVGLGGSVAAVALVGERRVAGKLTCSRCSWSSRWMMRIRPSFSVARPSALQDQYTNLSGSNAPRSVTMRVMRPAGVTSEGRVPHVDALDRDGQDLGGIALFDGDARAVRDRRSMVEMGAAT